MKITSKIVGVKMKLLTYLKIILYLIYSPCCLAVDKLTLMKYEYGMRGWDGVRYEKGYIYPLPYKYQYPSLTDEENNENLKKLNLKVNLSIDKKEKSVFGTIIIKNYGKKSVFIPDVSFSENSKNFSIITSNIVIKYLGGLIEYRGNYERDDWLEISPGETVSLTQKLNDKYEFLPGEHFYNISSKEYVVVTEKWFLEKSINDKFSSIITPQNGVCFIRDKPHLVLEMQWLCTSDVTKNSLSVWDFLEIFGLQYSYGNTSYKIRSNEKIIEIDGDHLTSLYD